MSNRSMTESHPSSAAIVATSPAAVRPAAARTRLLLEGPVFSTLLRLSAPNVLNLLAIAGMITFDGLFFGRLGADALAAVSLAFPFVMLIQHTAASGMGGGVSSAIARALGAGKRDLADALVFHTIVLALGLAAAFFDRAAARRTLRVSVDGRAWRDAVGRPRLRRCGVQRRGVQNLLGSAV